MPLAAPMARLNQRLLSFSPSQPSPLHEGGHQQKERVGGRVELWSPCWGKLWRPLAPRCCPERGPRDWRALSLASGIAAMGMERQKQKPK